MLEEKKDGEQKEEWMYESIFLKEGDLNYDYRNEMVTKIAA